MYTWALGDARLGDSSKSYYLIENHNPSHGTKTTYNIVYRIKNESWISRIAHPPQSPNLSPTEEQRILHGNSRLKDRELLEEKWDSTKSHLKKILQQEWDKIP
ncbi:hypothetical protein K469DRAFT_683511 [Zopfia rhizophila CBS 207.26]|uniref:Tc1-like transposase DDE domain-containing protein n=1 Tax=Zopfia rhizophila CBS 207.26 TaxID=1314779 RepID=A0A6A6DBZ8_9PEZI|nr:hypothetical protein K469DRAFT_683511 [Zopfia rhizophila CBS 207.26]